MATIIYLHGFASVGVGDKSEALKLFFPMEKVLAPNLPIEPLEVINIVDKLVQENKSNTPIVFVGTSLGGFWSNYFAHKYNVPAVIVNPAISPNITLADRVDKISYNYKTGEKIIVSKEHINKFKDLAEEAKSKFDACRIELFLAKDDDVIDYNMTLKTLPSYNSCVVTDDGGHRYEKYWGSIINKVKEVIERTNNKGD